MVFLVFILAVSILNLAIGYWIATFLGFEPPRWWVDWSVWPRRGILVALASRMRRIRLGSGARQGGVVSLAGQERCEAPSVEAARPVV